MVEITKSEYIALLFIKRKYLILLNTSTKGITSDKEIQDLTDQIDRLTSS